ncbi:MAG: folate-binding protein YgfZ [Cellvibrio sp.]|nr:folate-binding protein YgfZ [Cellvibrio sp.]
MSLDFGLLQIQGIDAIKFLQGQVTCDVAQTSPTQGTYGAHCNPKGRILFSFYLYRRADDCLWLQIPSMMLEQAQKDLAKYSVFSKVAISIVDKPIQLIHSPVQLPHSVFQDDGGIIRQRTHEYYEVIGHPAPINQVATFSTATDHWSLLDIQQGIAHIHPETRDMFTPEEINYTLIDAVSFRKGCYTGQEIIARMHYKGKHKRHAHRFVLDSAEIPTLGSNVISNISNQKIGEIISIAKSNNPNQFECLASIQDDARNHAMISTHQTMQPTDLPYAIPQTEVQ